MEAAHSIQIIQAKNISAHICMMHLVVQFNPAFFKTRPQVLQELQKDVECLFEKYFNQSEIQEASTNRNDWISVRPIKPITF